MGAQVRTVAKTVATTVVVTTVTYTLVISALVIALIGESFPSMASSSNVKRTPRRRTSSKSATKGDTTRRNNIHELEKNRFLGTCLDSAWVAQMEAELGVFSQDRDAKGRLLHPFLQMHSSIRINDPQTASPAAYADKCIFTNEDFFGADQPADGSTRGTVDGTLVIDMGDWDTSALVAKQVGYKVAIQYGGPTIEITQRMSSVGIGVCNPTHLTIEAWTSSSLPTLRIYFNESYLVGGLGYFGLSGIYVSHRLVEEGTSASPPYYPDFWKHYTSSDVLIDKLNVTVFKADNPYLPPAIACCCTIDYHYSRSGGLHQ
ncbi:unnamed protein product [Phytophthora lilii]|uniref:Unnamed protein product n=1 Tax=Phytophthora lilii TaxID=2077276 RepID=A0A9W6XBG1_9STRA|nr:unnamed protein product [Phytophthora lilii]